MLEAELQRLRRHQAAVARMLDELEQHLAQPLPAEPPYQVLSDAVLLQDRAYEMTRAVGALKRALRDRGLRHTLAAEVPLPAQ